jgi:hypothetical protein
MTTCSAPFTGPSCTETYADAVGSSVFWGYRAMYLSLGIILGAASIWELRSASSVKSAPSVMALQQQQQNYQRSIYLRLIAASVVFILCAIDPLGYADIIGVDGWLVFSGVSSFFVLSVCISLIFVVVRRIALVGSQHGLLPFFNSLYVYSQIGMFVTWVVLPIIQAIATRGYIVEAVKLICSSLIFLTWTIGSLAYGMSTVSKLKQTSDKKLSSSNNLAASVSSGVFLQRLTSLKTLNNLLWIASVLSVIFVAIQTVDAVHAIRSQDEVNFDTEDAAPANFGDLLLSGIFETIKQLFCFVVLGGMRYVRVTKEQTRNSVFAEEDEGGENIPLAEMPDSNTKKLRKDEDQDEEESMSSQTSILASDSHNAAA